MYHLTLKKVVRKDRNKNNVQVEENVIIKQQVLTCTFKMGGGIVFFAIRCMIPFGGWYV